MPGRLSSATAAITVSAALAFGLSGCLSSGTTYGTGVPPGRQTVKDLTGLVSLGNKGPQIDYQERPPVVQPPKAAALDLPPPGTDATVADWPNDPDLARKARLDALRHRKPGDPGPVAGVDIAVDPIPTNANPNNVFNPRSRFEDPKNVAERAKLFAEAKANSGLGKRDANGNLIRQSLYEPPTTYLEPDPTAPTEFDIATKKRRFHWPWLRDSSDAPASTISLPTNPGGP